MNNNNILSAGWFKPTLKPK